MSDKTVEKVNMPIPTPDFYALRLCFVFVSLIRKSFANLADLGGHVVRKKEEKP